MYLRLFCMFCGTNIQFEFTARTSTFLNIIMVIKEDEIIRACSMHERSEKFVPNTSQEP
jgi:hypothetical protein